MSASDATKAFNIVVLGAPGVGKSCIISQFLHHKFLESSGFTIELEQQTTVLADKKRQISLDIVDTPGGYCFQERRRIAMATGDAFILVFSLDKECSFETVAMLRDEIVRIKKTTKVPILLVGNKSDIDDEKRITSCKGAKLFAKKEWKTKYVDACAMDHNSVTEVFRKVLKLAKIKVSLGLLAGPLSTAKDANRSRQAYKSLKKVSFYCPAPHSSPPTLRRQPVKAVEARANRGF